MNQFIDKDKRLFETLMESLEIYTMFNGNTVKHEPLEKTTGSLYRFGWFYINGYKYSVSGWKFRDGLVTFENEETGEKVKYSIPNNAMKVGEFKKDNFLEKYVKLVRRTLSKKLKELSDKLQP